MDPGIRAIDEDFLSLDLDQLTAPRKADGSLPDIDLLRPASDSELLDAGVDIGFDYWGLAPDLGALEYNPTTGTAIDRYQKTDKTTLYPNYPNPFNPETTIRYTLIEPGYVTLTIYNMLGQKVRTLVEHHHHPGEFNVHWQGQNDASTPVASGIYVYQLTSSTAQGTHIAQKKMILLK